MKRAGGKTTIHVNLAHTRSLSINCLGHFASVFIRLWRIWHSKFLALCVCLCAALRPLCVSRTINTILWTPERRSEAI